MVEKIQVNLARSLRKVLRQPQYLYRNTFPDFPKDGDKRKTANDAQTILLQVLVQGPARSYGTEGVEGLKERNGGKAKERMRKRRGGWRKERDVNSLRWRY